MKSSLLVCQVTLDTNGKVTLPAELREVLDVKPGDRVFFRVDDGLVYLTVAPPEPYELVPKRHHLPKQR